RGGRGRLPDRRPPDRRLVNGEDELDAAALARRRLQFDLATQRRRELAGDRQPEAGALAVARPERPEDPLLLVCCDAGPVVLDGNADRPVLLRERDADPAAVRGPTERVREQVRDHLQDAVAVGLQPRSGGPPVPAL